MKKTKKLFVGAFIIALTFLMGNGYAKADTYRYGGDEKTSAYNISYHNPSNEEGMRPALRYLTKVGDTTNAKIMTYCAEEAEHTLAKDAQDYTKSTLDDSKLRAILSHSYPFVSLTEMQTAVQTYVRENVEGQSETTITLTQDEAITGIQAAIWKAEDTNKNYTDNNCTNCKYVYDYLLALPNSTVTAGSININVVSESYVWDTDEEDFVFTIEYNLTTSGLSNISNTLSVNSTDVTSSVTTLPTGNKKYTAHFSSKEGVSYTINASGTDNTFGNVYKYTADITNGENYQDLISYEMTNTNKSDTKTKTLVPELATLIISKVDKLTDALLAGAEFTLKNSAGEVIDTWTSLNTMGHTIEDLVPGKYSLTEDGTPEGYQALEAPVIIDITEIKVYSIDVDNEEIVEVEKTAQDKSLSYYFIGGVMLFAGITITASSKKKKYNK